MKVILKLTKDIYNELIIPWSNGNNFIAPVQAMLPKYCLLNVNGDIYTHIVAFYNTDSGLAWIGWELSNPKIHKDMKEGGLENLINGAIEYAKKSGYKLLFTTSNTPPVEHALKSIGFSIGDKNVKHYLKKL